MTSLIPTIALLMSAVNVSPALVPATGKQESVVTLDAPAMVRVTAKSPSGTSCTVVDKVRGPFTTSGVSGKSSCDTDLLLDIGSYKLRLQSPKRGKGKVDVTAKAFTELNAKPLKLERNKGPQEQTLRSGEQASFWLSLDKPEVPNLRIFGRTAGVVTVWRNGEWLEQVPFEQSLATPEPGRSIHEWNLNTRLEAGDYLVTVYGTAERPWAGSGVSDALTIELGHRLGPSERMLSFVLPASGFAAWQIPAASTAALLSLDGTLAATTTLALADFNNDNSLSGGRTCDIEAKQLVPQCSAFATSSLKHLLVVRGAPNTRGTIEWANHGQEGTPWRGGWYGGMQTQILFEGWNGDALLGVHDLPADTDAAPLSCQVERLRTDDTPEVVARDVVTIEDGQMIDAQFKYDGSSAAVWFEVKKSERYRIQTKGDRKTRCNVSRQENNGTLKQLTDTKDALCNESLVLTAGAYQVSIYNGLSGIERLVVREDNQRALKPTAPKAGCLLTAPIDGGRYRLVLSRVGAITARGLVSEPFPLLLAAPLHLTLDARRTVKLPLGPGLVPIIRSAAGAAFKCGYGAALQDSKDGSCAVPASAKGEVLTLTNPTDGVAAITLMRTLPVPAPVPALAGWNPASRPLPRVPVDAPAFFDFERNQSHSMVFDVDTAGLYNITTVGLLTTQCRMRTPVVPAVASDTSGGRGRNCLVSGYLRPGRYMVTVTTTGSSKGRAGVVMTRSSPREFSSVATDGEAYFRVDPGVLVQQKLNVKADADFALGTTGQGVSLLCRLDDAQGWPIETVPSACVGNRFLPAGTYLWTQLPLTVESMRRTRLEKVKEALVLKGNKPHGIDFHSWYAAKLGPDGKDEFTFKLEGELTLDVVLTGGMQGRIFLLETDKAPRAVEVIPPQAIAESSNEDSDEEEGYREEEPPREENDEDGGEEGEQEEERTTAGAAAVQAVRPPTTPSGVKVTLPPGQYKIVAEHSRGNVGVDYRLHLGSDTLVPGMTRTLPTPTTLPLKVPRDGTLRLRTEGEADVRCRLFDEKGTLVFEGSDNGADWNCALAEPVVKGNYTLVLESETQQRGETKLSVARAAVEDKGLVADAAALKLAASVQTFAIPVAEKDSVAELTFKSNKTPISCALEDGQGQVVHRQSRVTSCGLLVRPMTEKFRVRVWTTDGSAQVTVGYKSRPIEPFTGSTLDGATAGSKNLQSAGRFKTSPFVFCIAGNQRGLLRACGPEVSLEAGPAVFAAFGKDDQKVSLDPVNLELSSKLESSQAGLSRLPYLQSFEGPTALFLLTGQVPHGERTSPSCGFDGPGNVREGRDSTCFAATGVTSTAVMRAWTPVNPETPVTAKLEYRALKLPSKAEALVPGRRRLNWVDEAGVFALPPGARARLELTLPVDAWAVLLDDKGGAVDFCAPSGSVLARCVLTGKGGRVAITSAEPAADVTTVLLDSAEKGSTLTGLYEDAPRVPGTMRLKIPTGSAERTVLVEGNVDRCLLALSDGVRSTGCRATIPAGASAELILEHRPGAMRAAVFPTGRDRQGRLGVEPATTPAAALLPAVAVPIGTTKMDRTIVVEKDAVVRVTAESGVCALFKGNDLLAVDGLDAGCELVRLLSPGTYRLVVRPFAGQTGPGLLRWTSEPVAALKEGVGAEDWISPAEVRVYRFQTASKGKVGLGIQARSESLDCAVYNDGYQLLGEGCQQLLSLDKGSYLLTVRQPPKSGNAALRFKPVLVGLAGAKADVPDEYLRDLFNRIGVAK